MDEKKELGAEAKAAEPVKLPDSQPAKKFDIRTAVDLPKLIRILAAVVVAALLTYLTVWLEYTWMKEPTAQASYVGMLRFYLRSNNRGYVSLFYSIIACGMVAWTTVSLALTFAGRKLIDKIRTAIRAKKSAKA